MKIIHTSDWHLGQRFYDYERIDEQKAFLDWLFLLLKEREIDVLLISGDIFDTANPSSAAQSLFYNFISQCITLTNLQVIVTAGNHDSPSRLSAPSQLMSAFNTYIITAVERANGVLNYEKLIIPIYDTTGQKRAYVLAVPYLRQSDLGSLQVDPTNYPAAVVDFYNCLFTDVNKMNSENLPVLAMGHLFLHSSVTSDSERAVTGNLEVVSTDIFPETVAYVALGHIHKAQRVGSDSIRYSGSPYPLSFSEINYRHQVIQLTLSDKDLSIDQLFIPRSVELIRIGTPKSPLSKSEILSRIIELEERADREIHLAPFLEIHISLPAPDPTASPEILEALQGKYCRITGIRAHYPVFELADEQRLNNLDDLLEISPLQMFDRYYQEKYHQSVPEEIQTLFDEIVEQVSNE